MAAVYDGERKAGFRKKLFRLFSFFAAGSWITIALGGLIARGIFGCSVPDLASLEDSQPMVVSRMYDQSGQVIGEFYREKRIVLPYDQIPPKLVQAVLA